LGGDDGGEDFCGREAQVMMRRERAKKKHGRGCEKGEL